MTFDIKKLEEYGVDTGVGIEYTGSEDKYILALKRYLKAYEGNRARVTKDLETMDIEDYTIIVHSLKSNSKMIGAGGLGCDFEALELAAKSGNTSMITKDTPDILARYDALIDGLRPLSDDEEEKSKSITADKARQVTAQLLDALDEYDDELSTELASVLSGYPFDEKYSDMLKKASGLIGDFMYDEAAELIRMLSEGIK
ncbi:MAG: hypothetical protein K6E63_02655 [Lachnospiraceae bacterium]|nr:hypothetical protein [Lachnospiraceae bacterium]